MFQKQWETTWLQLGLDIAMQTTKYNVQDQQTALPIKQ